MNETIKLAIEKGAYPRPGSGWIGSESYEFTDEAKMIMLLDPLFWQAIGRALGWIVDATAPKEIEDKLPDSLKRGELVQMAGLIGQPLWLYNWHSFINHIAYGKTPDSFFEELIK